MDIDQIHPTGAPNNSDKCHQKVSEMGSHRALYQKLFELFGRNQETCVKYYCRKMFLNRVIRTTLELFHMK